MKLNDPDDAVSRVLRVAAARWREAKKGSTVVGSEMVEIMDHRGVVMTFGRPIWCYRVEEDA